MTRERYSLTVRLRGRIFISSIVYFSWTAARGWRMIFPLSLSSSRVPLSSILPPVGRQTQAGWWRWEARRSRGYAFQLGDGLCSAERRSPLHSTRFLSIPRWQIALWHHRGRILGEGGGKESNREMMFANRLTTAQRRFMLLGRFANREIGKWSGPIYTAKEIVLSVVCRFDPLVSS